MFLGTISEMVDWKPHVKCVGVKTVSLFLNKNRKSVFQTCCFSAFFCFSSYIRKILISGLRVLVRQKQEVCNLEIILSLIERPYLCKPKVKLGLGVNHFILAEEW